MADVDPAEHPDFAPVFCRHGRLRAWVSEPVTLDVPEVEDCPDCETSMIVDPA